MSDNWSLSDAAFDIQGKKKSSSIFVTMNEAILCEKEKKNKKKTKQPATTQTGCHCSLAGG